eukprot:COSAG01_NODE_517_length_16020_cov_42.983167_6_plen_98_part_00
MQPTAAEHYVESSTEHSTAVGYRMFYRIFYSMFYRIFDSMFYRIFVTIGYTIGTQAMRPIAAFCLSETVYSCTRYLGEYTHVHVHVHYLDLVQCTLA